MPLIRGTRYATLARGAARNVVPTITVPGAQSATSNVALAITGTSIADPESQSQTVAITVTNGTFSLASTTGLSFSVGDGTADAAMTFSGTLANVNTAIATLTFTSTTDFEGSSTLTINSTDSGGGVATQKTVAITVAWNFLSLSTLQAWFDVDPAQSLVFTDAGTTVAQAGDVVRRIVSRNSGSVYLEQATLGNRGTLRQGANGKYYIEFNGTSGHYSLTGVTINKPSTLMLNAQPQTRAGSWNSIMGGGSSAYAVTCAYYLSPVKGQIAREDTTMLAQSTATITKDAWNTIIAGHDDSTAAKWSVNGSNGTGTVVNSACTATTFIGRSQASANYFKGYMGDIALTSDLLSDANITLANTYLTARQPT